MKYLSWGYYYALFFSVLLFSCKKEELIGSQLDELINTFSISGEMYPAFKNETEKSVLVVVPSSTDKTNLTASYTSTAGVQASINNLDFSQGVITCDYSLPVQLQLRALDYSAISNWTITVKTESEVLGLGSKQTAANSIKGNQNYYYEQRGSGTYATINCGPAVATMAVKWADSTFSKQVVDARNAIKPQGGWWNTGDVSDYLDSNDIKHDLVELTDFSKDVMNCIDKNYMVVLCLDMYEVSYNPDVSQQTNKYYQNTTKGSGHFIVVKGYCEVDGNLFFECYDPRCGGDAYFLNAEPRGKNRYYAAEELALATAKWYNYALAVAPKGRLVKIN